MMKIDKQNKFIILILLTLFGTINNAIPQKPKPLKGKYCKDLGFGWECLDFKANGKCKIAFGHSYWTSKSKGKWMNNDDTIVLIQFTTKNFPKDTTYYYYKSDTLYSISFKNKIAIRGKALEK